MIVPARSPAPAAGRTDRDSTALERAGTGVSWRSGRPGAHGELPSGCRLL